MNNNFYFYFVFDEYLKNHSESKYLYDLIDSIDWSSISDTKNCYGVGTDGYSPRSMCKALFLKLVKCFSSVNDLICFLKNKPRLSFYIGFDVIINKVPHESTFSKFRKSFDCDFIYHVISHSIIEAINEGIFYYSTIFIYSLDFFDDHKLLQRLYQLKFEYPACFENQVLNLNNYQTYIHYLLFLIHNYQLTLLCLLLH